MRKLFIIAVMSLILISCGGGQGPEVGKDASGDSQTKSNTSPYDENRGEGKFSSVDLGDKLNAEMAATGDKVQGMKCSPCHKLTAEKLVGPGWEGVTERRKPEWIMNFITNPDPMIDKDPAVQLQFEMCLIRMPNQALSDDDARAVLEFMRKNDGIK